MQPLCQDRLPIRKALPLLGCHNSELAIVFDINKMFRNPRSTLPHWSSHQVGQVLRPFPVIPWGNVALTYLGVNMMLGLGSPSNFNRCALSDSDKLQIDMLVVADSDYEPSVEKLRLAGSQATLPVGPLDRRITKRLGSGREMAGDMRGRPLAP